MGRLATAEAGAVHVGQCVALRHLLMGRLYSLYHGALCAAAVLCVSVYIHYTRAACPLGSGFAMLQKHWTLRSVRQEASLPVAG
jgi:hypothetical protein